MNSKDDELQQEDAERKPQDHDEHVRSVSDLYERHGRRSVNRAKGPAWSQLVRLRPSTSIVAYATLGKAGRESLVNIPRQSRVL